MTLSWKQIKLSAHYNGAAHLTVRHTSSGFDFFLLLPYDVVETGLLMKRTASWTPFYSILGDSLITIASFIDVIYLVTFNRVKETSRKACLPEKRPVAAE